MLSTGLTSLVFVLSRTFRNPLHFFLLPFASGFRRAKVISKSVAALSVRPGLVEGHALSTGSVHKELMTRYTSATEETICGVSCMNSHESL